MAKAEKLVPANSLQTGGPNSCILPVTFAISTVSQEPALQMSCNNNLFSIHFGGNYQVSGSKCLCTAGIPVTPWISGNCGFYSTASSQSEYGPEYQPSISSELSVRINNHINHVQPVDKCAVSVFSSDITQLVMDSIRSSLSAFTSAMDRNIAGLNFAKFVTQLKDSSFRKIAIGKYGYFLLIQLLPHWATELCER